HKSALVWLLRFNFRMSRVAFIKSSSIMRKKSTRVRLLSQLVRLLNTWAFQVNNVFAAAEYRPARFATDSSLKDKMLPSLEQGILQLRKLLISLISATPLPCWSVKMS